VVCLYLIASNTCGLLFMSVSPFVVFDRVRIECKLIVFAYNSQKNETYCAKMHRQWGRYELG